MKTIQREDYLSFFNGLIENKSLAKVEVTTFDYETIIGVVQSIKEYEEDEISVLILDDQDVLNEVEIDFIYEVLMH